jgi:hypothetical protein
MRLAELLTHDVAVACADEPLLEVIARMRDMQVGTILVVEDRDGGRLPIEAASLGLRQRDREAFRRCR